MTLVVHYYLGEILYVVFVPVSTAGTCHSGVLDDRCKSFGYTEVAFPNFASQRTPYSAGEWTLVIDHINNATHCYKYSYMFACYTLMPKCSGSGQVPQHAIPPCRSLCNGKLKINLSTSLLLHVLFCSVSKLLPHLYIYIFISLCFNVIFKRFAFLNSFDEQCQWQIKSRDMDT